MESIAWRLASDIAGQDRVVRCTTLSFIVFWVLAFAMSQFATAQDAMGVKYVSPVVERSTTCWGRETAESMARRDLDNKASAMCRELPGKWLLNRKAITSESYGYMQCFPCKNSPGEFSCMIERSRMPCENLEKKKEDKPKESDAAAGAAKEKAGKAGAAEGSKSTPTDVRLRDQASTGRTVNDCTRSSLRKQSAAENALDGPASDSGCAPDQKANSPSSTSRKIWDDLDESAADGQIKTKHDQLVRDFRGKAEMECRAEWSRISACYKTTGCRVPSESETEQCVKAHCGNEPQKRIAGKCLEYEKPKLPANAGSGTKYFDLFPKCERYAEGPPNPMYSYWEQCIASASHCRIDLSCVNRCNPSQYRDADGCVQSRMARAPTESEARAAVRQDWKLKESQPKKSSASRNFLD